MKLYKNLYGFFYPAEWKCYVFCCRNINMVDFGVLPWSPLGHLWYIHCITFQNF